MATWASRSTSRRSPSRCAAFAPPPASEAEMDRPATILVVDDVPANIELLEGLLVTRGYRVIAAGSGEEALERVRCEGPDLVLLDVLMPGMDGYETCRRLRADPA